MTLTENWPTFGCELVRNCISVPERLPINLFQSRNGLVFSQFEARLNCQRSLSNVRSRRRPSRTVCVNRSSSSIVCNNFFLVTECVRLVLNLLPDSACPLRFLFRYSPNTGAAVKARFVPCPCGDVATNPPSNQFRQQLIVDSRWSWGADGIVNWLSFVSQIHSLSTNRKM